MPGANKCWAQTGCRYFTWGLQKGPKGAKRGQCSWERTRGRLCAEGWLDDSTDFYQIKGNLALNLTLVSGEGEIGR